VSTQEVHDDEGGAWWSWLWTAVTRLRPLPVNLTPNESTQITQGEKCQGSTECLWLIATTFGQFGRFLGNQSWKLLKDPFDWVDHFPQLMIEQLKRIRRVEKELLGVVSWTVMVNLWSWILLKLWKFAALPGKAQRMLRNLPLIQLTVLLYRIGLSVRNSKVKELEEKLAELTRKLQVKKEDLLSLAQEACPVDICRNCGQRGHRTMKCPHKTRCFRCQQFGHVAKDCPVEQSAVNKVLEMNETPECSALVQSPLFVSADVGLKMHKVQLLADTGSSVNVLPLSKAKKFSWMVEELSPDDKGMMLRSFNGTLSQILGSTTQRVKIGDWTGDITFMVVPDASKAILGLPALSALGLIVDATNARLVDGAGRFIMCHPACEKSPNCQVLHSGKDTSSSSKKSAW